MKTSGSAGWFESDRFIGAFLSVSVGVALPYAVGILPILLFRERLQSMDYYTSGKLATFDTVTGWLTFGAFVLGLALCWPWFETRLVSRRSRPRWLVFGLAVVIVQLVTVFVVRFLAYLKWGGPL